jgi:hypothetical protein
MNNPQLDAERRALRRNIALALLFSPTMCVLPVLAFVAGQSGIRWVIWLLWAGISLILLVIVVRAAARLRTLAAADQDQSDQKHPL